MNISKGDQPCLSCLLSCYQAGEREKRKRHHSYAWKPLSSYGSKFVSSWLNHTVGPIIEGKTGGTSSAWWEGLAKGMSEREVSLAPGLERSMEMCISDRERLRGKEEGVQVWSKGRHVSRGQWALCMVGSREAKVRFEDMPGPLTALSHIVAIFCVPQMMGESVHMWMELFSKCKFAESGIDSGDSLDPGMAGYGKVGHS